MLLTMARSYLRWAMSKHMASFHCGEVGVDSAGPVSWHNDLATLCVTRSGTVGERD